MRTFASKSQRRPPSPWMYRPDNILNISGLRQIMLPDTWRGRRAVRKVRKYWFDELKKLTGKEPTTKDPTTYEEPLLLYIDDRPTTKLTVVSSGKLQVIVFIPTDKIGQELWRVANLIQWSERSKWIKYPTYAIVGLYSSLFVLWFCNRDQVPITGRWQFQCIPT